MKTVNKTELKALYVAYDIHRRAATLAAMWIAFDPFGAVVYSLRDFEADAFDLRMSVENMKDNWCFANEPNHPLKPIKAGADMYGTFQNHIKGLQGAIRRFVGILDCLPSTIFKPVLLKAVKQLKVDIEDIRSFM